MSAVSDLTHADVEGVSTVTSGAKTIAAFIVQVLSYCIIAFLAVRVLLDLTYIAIPFTRTFLANGYTGQAQSSGQGTYGNMNGMGMNTGMSGGMSGGYGMRRGYGMSGGMTGMNGSNNIAGQNAMVNRNSGMVGNIQFVSNAALNAVASESTIGPDGKSQSAFKIYSKDMMVTLIIVPVLIILAATGAITQLGLVLGNYIVEGFSKIGGML
jgi:hypothetical protein